MMLNESGKIWCCRCWVSCHSQYILCPEMLIQHFSCSHLQSLSALATSLSQEQSPDTATVMPAENRTSHSNYLTSRQTRDSLGVQPEQIMNWLDKDLFLNLNDQTLARPVVWFNYLIYPPFTFHKHFRKIYSVW